MDIVGYDAEGKAITFQEFIDRIEEAEEQYQSGKYKTIDVLERDLDNVFSDNENKDSSS